MASLRSGWVLSLVVVIAGCGSEDPGAHSGSGGTQSQAGAAGDGDSDGGGGEIGDAGSPAPYLPWAEGNTWTYRVTKDTEVFTKVNLVGPLEPVGGTGPNQGAMAHYARTEKGADFTESWQVRVGDRVIRYRERNYSESTGALDQEVHWDPHKIHFDDSPQHTADGASWLEEFEETKMPVGAAPLIALTRDRWTVLAVDQEVTVPAGTFSAIVVQKVSLGSVKTYHYVRGVGKVREEGGQLEELVSYDLAPK